MAKTRTKMATLVLIYDGDCPVCQAYTAMLRLRESFTLELINARDGGPLVDRYSTDYDLNEGFLLLVDEAVYHGEAAIHRLALMSSPSGLCNRFNAWVFRSDRRSRLLYPWLKAGRNLLLRMLGRSRL